MLPAVSVMPIDSTVKPLTRFATTHTAPNLFTVHAFVNGCVLCRPVVKVSMYCLEIVRSVASQLLLKLSRGELLTGMHNYARISNTQFFKSRLLDT